MKNFKKITLGLLGATILSLGLYACSNDNDATKTNLNELKESETIKSAKTNMLGDFKNYMLRNNLIENPEFLNLEKSFIREIDGVEVINLVEISSDNTKINIYRGIKTSDSGKLLISNYNEYLMIQEKYVNINIESLSVKLSKFDLNQRKFKFQEATIVDGTVVNEWMYDLGLGTVQANGSLPSDCKGGKDGNLSWGECMNCVKSVCSSDPTCDSICDSLNIAKEVLALIPGSGIAGALAGCDTALAIGCVGAAAAH